MPVIIIAFSLSFSVFIIGAAEEPSCSAGGAAGTCGMSGLEWESQEEDGSVLLQTHATIAHHDVHRKESQEQVHKKTEEQDHHRDHEIHDATKQVNHNKISGKKSLEQAPDEDSELASKVNQKNTKSQIQLATQALKERQSLEFTDGDEYDYEEEEEEDDHKEEGWILTSLTRKETQAQKEERNCKKVETDGKPKCRRRFAKPSACGSCNHCKIWDRCIGVDSNGNALIWSGTSSTKISSYNDLIDKDPDLHAYLTTSSWNELTQSNRASTIHIWLQSAGFSSSQCLSWEDANGPRTEAFWCQQCSKGGNGHWETPEGSCSSTWDEEQDDASLYTVRRRQPILRRRRSCDNGACCNKYTSKSEGFAGRFTRGLCQTSCPNNAWRRRSQSGQSSDCEYCPGRGECDPYCSSWHNTAVQEAHRRRC
eukprot:gnl/MRDRNA2_/MRDRNA2_99923_c0_seq1.p1 gnl/MRDRNA2_/MRDRNA2_99923_c0~~gnl/MRDRNA2_/MRDRNA2_99923_c0_seq1.p1  ORF type:complete len:424 (+),score=71.40 gnl/MRDRNA2_/MRDRNA2_99923_c0_seq1:117-1388(+)